MAADKCRLGKMLNIVDSVDRPVSNVPCSTFDSKSSAAQIELLKIIAQWDCQSRFSDRAAW